MDDDDTDSRGQILDLTRTVGYQHSLTRGNGAVEYGTLIRQCHHVFFSNWMSIVSREVIKFNVKH